MSQQNTLIFELKQLDSSSNTMARRTFTVTDSAASAGEFRSGILLDTNQTTINLPYATIRQLLIRNTHATGKITVVFTPNGGAESTINKLGPGGTMALWDSTTAATTIGITSLKFTADTANTTFELFAGG